MNIYILIGIIAVLFAIYLYYYRLFLTGIKKKKNLITKQRDRVSVVIAARNEEKNLPFLLTTLVNQTYPQDLYEVIIADDSSTDRTAKIIKDFSANYPFVKYHLVTNRENVVSPKKNALEQAIAKSEGDIILTTDADCIVNIDWIKTMTAHFDKDTAMVAGYSRTKIDNWSNASFIQKFDHFDFAVMMMITAGTISQDRSFTCVGQNLAYKKEHFYKVGGFKKIKHYLSGDDAHLLGLFKKSGFKIRFSFHPKSFNFTEPIEDTRDFLNQRSRWYSNINLYFKNNKEFGFYLATVSLLYYIWFTLLFFNWKAFLVVAVLKAAADYYFIKKSHSKFLFPKEYLKFYPFWFLFQPVYSLIAYLAGTLRIFNWKGRN